MPQLYYSPISINAAQVPTTQTNFPVLVSVTDARFKDVAHSGHVNRSDGFDIRPYTDTTLGTAITGYELERYTPTTGEVVMWVKVASVSSSTTPIVLGYGDTSITADGSSTTTWSNGFFDVYHLKDGTTLNVNSSVSTGHNGTNHGATAATGQIDGGAGFVSASGQYIETASLTISDPTTFSAWINATSFPNAYNTVMLVNNTNSVFIGFFVKSTGKVGWFANSASEDGTGSHTLVSSTWYYLTLVYNVASGLVCYVNAASDATHVFTGNQATTSNLEIGRDLVNAGRLWNGVIDEVRISNAARSADWITTEYNNQSSPSTFETLGAEVQIAPLQGLFRL